MESQPADLIVKRARAFRRALTEPEVMLWSRLKGRGQDRPVFRRQFPYETLIFDFYCPKARLAVEIDGSTHWEADAQARDQRRDAWLARRGIEVMRIGAGEVFHDLSAVAHAVILRAVARIEGR